MLRINLLPPYIYDKQKKIKWIAAAVILPIVTAVAMVLWGQSAQAALDDQNKRKTEALTQQEQYTKYVQDIKKEKDTVAATQAKQEFVSNAKTYNAAWPHVYTAMRDFTSPKVLLKSMYVSDDRTSINFTGFCQAEEDLVRWWMFLRQQGDFYSDIHFRLPEHPYPPKADTTAGAGGPGGIGAKMPGMGGSMGGSPSAMGGMGAPGMAGMGASGGPGGGGGTSSFGGGGGSSDAVGEEEIEGRKGIKFSATATLKKPLAGGIPTPTWATAGGAASGGGSGPMGGGMGGGRGGSGGPGAMSGPPAGSSGK